MLTVTSLSLFEGGSSLILGAFNFKSILLIFSRALLGFFSMRYLRDSGIINQATMTILTVTTPPKRNIILQPYSGRIYPATTEVIIAPVGYPAVTMATDSARYLSGLYSAARDA